MAVGSAIVFLVVLLQFRSQRALVRELRAHGVGVVGVVTRVEHHTRSASDIHVRFRGPTGDVQSVLSIVDTEPDVETGQELFLVYDPHHPSRVLANSQLRASDPWAWVLLVGAVVAIVAGVGWWQWEVRRRPDASETPVP